MSAMAPAPRWPSASCLISRAGCQVLIAITFGSGMPIARHLSMTLSMSFMPAFMLLMCKSVEIESGMKPAFTIGIAMPQLKLPPPWPTSKITPRLRPSTMPGFGLPSTSSFRSPEYMWV